jgi:hypothetical protein
MKQLYLTLQLSELPFLWCSFIFDASSVPFILSATYGIYAAVRRVLVFYPEAPFILQQQQQQQQRHFTSVVHTRVTHITPSRGHNWKRSAHVISRLPLVISQASECHNYTKYGRMLTKFGI